MGTFAKIRVNESYGYISQNWGKIHMPFMEVGLLDHAADWKAIDELNRTHRIAFEGVG